MGPIENSKSVVCVFGGKLIIGVCPYVIHLLSHMLIHLPWIGGNSAHVLIPFLSASGHKVNLLTRRPDAWCDTVTCELQSPSKKRTMVDFGNVKHPAADVLQTVKGTINKKSSDPKDVIPESVRVNSLYK
jgi:hypothetical protein